MIVSCKQNNEAIEDHPAFHNPTIQPYTDSVNNNPDVALYYYLRSIALHNINADSLSEMDLDKAINLDSTDARFPLAKGFLYLDKGKTKESIAFFKKAVSLQPNNDEYKMALLGAYIKNEDAVNAQTLLNKVLEKYPDITTLEIPKAQVALISKDTVTAMNTMNLFLAKHPYDIKALNFKAELLALKNDATVIPLYEKIYQIDTTEHYALELAGDFYYYRNDMVKAKEYYRKTIIASTDAATAFYKIAEIYVLEDSLDKALANYSYAINAQPNYAEAFLGKANIYQKMNQKDSADKYFQLAYLYNPNLKKE